jgi:hypothetical protein
VWAVNLVTYLERRVVVGEAPHAHSAIFAYSW